MVFNIARTVDIVRLERTTGEFVEDRHIRFANDVHQRIQPPAMGHANRHGLYALPGGLVDNGMQSRNGDFAPFQPKALGAHITLLTERLETFGLRQVPQDALALFNRNAGLPVIALKACAEPFTLFRRSGLHVFCTKATAINSAQGGNNVLDLAGCLTLEQRVDQRTEKDFAVQILGAKAIGGGPSSTRGAGTFRPSGSSVASRCP